MNGPFSASLSSLSSNNVFGLITLSIGDENIPSTFYLQNNYYVAPTFDFEQSGTKVTYNNNSEVYAIKQRYLTIPFILGQLPPLEDNYYNYKFRLYDNNNSLTTTEYNYKTMYNLNTSQNIGNESNLGITNDIYLQYGSVRANYDSLYKLEIDVYTDSTTYETFEYYYVFLPINAVITNGIITNYGSGDFNLQDNAVNNTEIAKDNQSFFKGLYDSLFTVSSGEIQATIDNIVEQTNLDQYTEVSFNKEILEALSGDPGDFIISWDTIKWQNQNIIPSGEINFTYIATSEEYGLSQITAILRVIMCFTATEIILHQIWIIIMRCLGVGSELYEEREEEKARLEDTIEQHEYYDDMGGYTDTTVRYPSQRLSQTYRNYHRPRKKGRTIGF